MYMEVGKVKQGSSNGRIILTVKLITPPYWLVKYIIWPVYKTNQSLVSPHLRLFTFVRAFFMSFGGQDLGSN